MQQIVIDPGKIDFEPAHRMLMLAGPYTRVYERFWTSALIKLDDEENPTLLIKATQSTKLLKDHPFKIGVSFIKGEFGNLFSIFVQFGGPSPFNCPTKPLVVFEDILGMDFAEVHDRLTHQMEMENLNIWLI